MFTTVISWLAQCILFAYNTFVTFVTDSFFGLFISFFTILLVVRLILRPILGGSMGSDKVKKKGSEDS